MIHRMLHHSMYEIKYLLGALFFKKKNTKCHQELGLYIQQYMYNQKFTSSYANQI